MKYPPNSACPCHSEKAYRKCCGPYHGGEVCPTPDVLMRSRYAAYALRMPGYIMKTTHPESPQWQADVSAWHKEILAFSRTTRFKGLEILEAPAPEENPGEGAEAQVTFRADLWGGQEDRSFTEKSLFVHHEGRWKYFSAEFLES